MNIVASEHDHYVTIAPEGELDANSSVHLDEKIRSFIDQDYRYIHVNMSGIKYISSAGLGVFISYLDELTQNEGKFLLTQLADNVHEVFTILGLDKIDNLKLSQESIDPTLEFQKV